MRPTAWTRSLLAGLLICLMGASCTDLVQAQQPKVGGGAVGVDPTPGNVEAESKPEAKYDIDPKLAAPGVPKTVISAGQERPVGLLRAPSGAHEAFVIDEVVLRAETQEELNAFLEKYDGTILKDGSRSSLPAHLRVRDVRRSKWFLIRVNLSRSSLDDLTGNMVRAGIKGNVVFSSEDAARLTAVVAREARAGAWANLLIYSTSSLEHPDRWNGNLDAESFPWMEEDSNPRAAGDQGLSVGVTHAWEALAYKKIPPTSGSWSPVRVAVVDTGFAFIEHTLLDGVLLDAKLHGRPVNEILSALSRRNVPFVFVTGYGRDSLPPTFREVAMLAKPFTRDQVLDAAAQLLQPETGH